MNSKLAALLVFVLCLSHLKAEDPVFEMRLVVPEGTPGAVEKTLKGQNGRQDQVLWCAKDSLLDPSAVKTATAYADPQHGWLITIEFNEAGAKLFAKATIDHQHERIGILSHGEMLSAPMVNEPITGGRAEISGNFTEAEAKKLAESIQGGTAPAK